MSKKINDDFDLDPIDLNILPLMKKNKKRVNSRDKGIRFENKIAKILNERFNTTDFCRTPGSGAFATTHSLPDHLKVYGDLITPKDFNFIIECKKGYNDEGICDFFNEKSQIYKMIQQASRDAKKAGKNYLLIIGQDRKDPVVVTNINPYITEINMLFGVLKNNISIYVFSLKDMLSLDTSIFFGFQF